MQSSSFGRNGKGSEPRMSEIESERSEGESIGESFKSEISKELSKKSVKGRTSQKSLKNK